MGTVFNYGQYEVDIDVERTRLFYDKARLVSSGCACSGCRNFEKAVNNLPSEVADAFEQMGIDMRKVCECYTIVYEDGKVLYGGFFHVCGRMLRGESAWEKKTDSHNAWNDDAAFALTDDFRISFQKELCLLETDFPLPALQIEFLAWIPWSLDESWD